MVQKTLLVVSAHAADFVWRCGGTIARYLEDGHKVYVIVLSYGVRGESNDLWKQEGQTEQTVREVREAESREAARILGVTQIEYWDYEDYPIYFNRERLDRLAKRIREVNPDFIITHDKCDAFNPDHNKVSEAVYESSVMAHSAGVQIQGTETAKPARFYGFEPHQTELSGFVPGMLMDITPVYEKKIEAMKCFKAQSHLIEYYTQRAFLRGNHARRISGISSYRYAESFSQYFPNVDTKLV